MRVYSAYVILPWALNLLNIDDLSQVTNTIDAAGLATGTGFAFEIDQGKNLVDACKETNVKFYVWRYMVYCILFLSFMNSFLVLNI